jgi:hypothetical protein
MEEQQESLQEESNKLKQSDEAKVMLKPGQHTERLPDGGHMIITDGFINA